ncbi:MAG: alpha-L-fucosidase [Planctomycetaceae bacterium]|nr:alpha-L-fucosidase [Planctomycetaceae bacterium]
MIVNRTVVLFLAAASALAGCQSNAVAPSCPDRLARDERMEWFREARYGMFVHYGPFSQWYDWYVSKTLPNKPPEGATPEQRKRWYVAGLTPPRDFARAWARTAKAAGMKYIVFTTKHHEGFVLWDTKLTEFNSINMGPRFDMVAEYVKACREEGLKVGFYYSLWDHNYPDGLACRHDDDSRRRFLDYTQALLRELMTNYGKIDILWYDGPSPLGYGGEWEAQKMNAMVRRLQPGIIINDRSLTAEDFTCSEGHISATLHPDSDWEACMPFHHKLWTWYPTDFKNYYTPRDIVDMFRQIVAGTGNLLLNVGPNPATGRIGQLEQERLAVVGKWLQSHGEAIYGHVDRPEALGFITSDAGGYWTRKGNTAYLWLPKWPAGGKIVLNNVHGKLLGASILTNGAKLTIDRTAQPDTETVKKASRVTLSGLPEKCPDAVCDYAIVKIEFAAYPR